MQITRDTPISKLYHSDDELTHWLGKGTAAKVHKYIKREWRKTKWVYWYKKPEKKKSTKSLSSTLFKKTATLIDSGKKTLTALSNKTKKIITRAKQNVHKYIAKVPTKGSEYRYFYSDKAYQAYLRGKTAVDKILNNKVNVSPSDTAKANAQNFTLKALFSGFGKSVFNVVAPALVSIQTAADTPDSFSELKKTKAKQTNNEHQEAVNPKYKSTTYDYSMNCSFCTAAYDLRKRGYDVEANPISAVEGYTIDDITSWYKGAKSVSEATVTLGYKSRHREGNATRADALTESLERQGEGARGHLALYWSYGGGHDIVWEVENGKVVYRDTQLNKVIDPNEYLSRASSYEYVRIDNLEPTDAVLRTVRNRKSR